MEDSRYALVAQLVEQRTENPRVTGSIPVQGIFLRCGKIWSVQGGTDKNVSVTPFAGLNYVLLYDIVHAGKR